MEKISKAQVKLVRSLQQKKFRDELGLFVAEGEKCVEELRKAYELVYRIQSTDRPAERAQAGSLSATPTEIEQMSGLRTPQGVIGVFKKDNGENGDAPKVLNGVKGENDDLVLVLDGVQDPGNLGTIIRTCNWFGVHDLICSQDTADCYNPKVVQATMGALARVRVHYVNLPEWLKELRIQNAQLRIYGTLLDGKNMYEMLNGESALNGAKGAAGIIVMGNEGNGISPEVRPYITHPLFIPPYPNKEASEIIESLNVSIATAIVLAEFRRP